MAIVAKRRNVEGRVISQANLQKLLLPNEFHPNGRVQLDPVTRMPKAPSRNILYTKKVRVRGRELDLPVNGGHAKADNSVWRIALGGPARYSWKLMRDELLFRLRGSRAITAPQLEDAEMLEARQFIAFLKSEKGNQVLPADFLNKKYDNGMREQFAEIDKKFYAWLKKQEKMPDLPKITDIYEFLPA